MLLLSCVVRPFRNIKPDTDGAAWILYSFGGGLLSLALGFVARQFM